MDRATWENKKAELRRQQETFNENLLLRRVYNTAHGKEVTDTEPWPATLATLQRIATFMDPSLQYTPTKVMRKLEEGDRLTTRYGAVYFLITKANRQ